MDLLEQWIGKSPNISILGCNFGQQLFIGEELRNSWLLKLKLSKKAIECQQEHQPNMEFILFRVTHVNGIDVNPGFVS